MIGKKTAPLSQPLKSITNRDSLAHVSLHFMPAGCILFKFLLVSLECMCPLHVIGQSDYVGFGFTTLNRMENRSH